MATIQVEMVIGQNVFVIQATGPLAEALEECKTSADVIKVFAEVHQAADALQRASLHRFSGVSQKNAYSEARMLARELGLSTYAIRRASETSVVISHLDVEET